MEITPLKNLVTSSCPPFYFYLIFYFTIILYALLLPLSSYMLTKLLLLCKCTACRGAIINRCIAAVDRVIQMVVKALSFPSATLNLFHLLMKTFTFDYENLYIYYENVYIWVFFYENVFFRLPLKIIFIQPVLKTHKLI